MNARYDSNGKQDSVMEEDYRESYNLNSQVKQIFKPLATERIKNKEAISNKPVSYQEKRKKKEYSSLFILGPKNKVRLVAMMITKAKYLFVL